VNYGYGSQASILQWFSNGFPPSTFARPFYSFSINSPTATIPGKISPGTANALVQQQQAQGQQQQLNGSAGYDFSGYNMLCMGIPSVGPNGFPYSIQVASFSGLCAYRFI
jgi:hypothetical protein